MDCWTITIAQTAPVLPYLLMVLMLIVRPTRSDGDAGIMTATPAI